MSEGTQRRLAAIVSADVVGYSRLMGVDEAGTHARLKARFSELVGPLIAEYGGRVVKLMGDGLLAEFPSVVDAVSWAIDVQTKVGELEADGRNDQRIEYRVGVNLGDVIVDGDDIFGDGVNIAARLQEIAEPGGICISEKVHGEVHGKLRVEFADGGAQQVKNIAQPIHVWQWPTNNIGAALLPVTDGAPLPLPDKPSIAVLPFANMSGDLDQEYFADGITEDIITNLSQIRWLFVIARNSSFVFKDKAVDVRQVSRELGVRYVLEGSVRKAGNKIRITAQLIDATTSAHLWAQRYDRDLTDIFAVQDEITQNVAGAIEPEILAAEGLRARERSEEDLDAWDLVMRAASTHWKMTKEDSDEAIAQLERAVEIYPDYGPACSQLAFSLLFAGHMGWRDLEAARQKAELFAKKAISIDDHDAGAHITLGYMHAINRLANEAVLEFTKAIELNPNFAVAYGWRGFTLAHAGRSQEAIADIDLAIRLGPKDPQNAIFFAAAGVAHLIAERIDEAIACAEESIRIRPGFIAGHRVLCAALAEGGRLGKAQTVLAQIKELHPDVTVALLRETLPYSSPEVLDIFVGGLCKAGLE